MRKKKKDLKSIANRIKKSKEVHLGVAVDTDYLEVVRKYTQEHKGLPIPEDFFVWLSEINGLYVGCVELYSLQPGVCNSHFTDVFAANKEDGSPKRIILGETEFDYLVYLPEENSYELQDRVNESSIAVFATLADALVYLLGV